MAYGPSIEQALLRIYEPDTLFRIEAVSYAAIAPYADPVTGDGEWYTTKPKLEVSAYPVAKWTEHGATLKIWSGARPKWVDLRPGKQWASRTIEEAVRQFEQRRARQIWILQRQLASAEYERKLAISACNAFSGVREDLLSATEIPQ